MRFTKRRIYGTVENGVPPNGRFLADWMLGMQPAANSRLIIIREWKWWHHRWSQCSQEQGIQGLRAHASCKNCVNLGVGNPESRAHASHLHPPLAFWRSPMHGRWGNSHGFFCDSSLVHVLTLHKRDCIYKLCFENCWCLTSLASSLCLPEMSLSIC